MTFKKTPVKRRPPSFRRQLIRLGACKEALKWVGNKTLAQAWRECDEVGWMWWLIAEVLGLRAYLDAKHTLVAIRKQFPARVIANAMKEIFK